jgi:hypothetical protein
MFDEGYCAGMALGAPQISIEGLNELATVLTLLGETPINCPEFQPPELEENGGAKENKSKINPACSCSGSPEQDTADAAGSERAHRSLGRSSARLSRVRKRNDGGRQE